MTDKTNEIQKYFDIVSKICTMLIPVILFCFGNEIRKSQDADNKQQQNFNRITTLLKSLSSDNHLERKLAMQFSKDLATSGNFPTELLSVMSEIHSSDSSISKDAGTVLNIVNARAIADKNTFIEQQIKQVTEDSPTKVYMQVPKSYDMSLAKQLLYTLKKEGFNMLGIERVDKDKSPANNEVRYFKPSERDLAEEMTLNIKKIVKDSVNVKYIQGYENKIMGPQIEIWLK